ncbi:MAG: hypothetical protein AAF943_13525 [Pseudomonadota bacterium]
MQNRRKPQHHITPADEDSGLFKGELIRVQARLIPDVQRNMRQDLLVRARMGQDQEIIVIFAGRRTRQAAPLLNRLLRLRAVPAQGGLAEADSDAAVLPNLRAEIEGAWRVRFQRDAEGWESRDFQLCAARWRLLEPKVEPSFTGSLPVRG